MRRFYTALAAASFLLCATPNASRADAPPATIAGRLIASGIPGIAAVSAVGIFHPGGPIHDIPEFAKFTEKGRVLDPERILVTSSSNFGAAGTAGIPEGSVLSIDASAAPVRVPAKFAAAGGQVSALDGRVQMFTSSSPLFANGVNTPKAVTADLPPVSNPVGISINNAFGRLWFPSVPHGTTQPGFESIVDPNGVPLANAPDQLAGGVFTGTKTNRVPKQFTPGAMTTGLIANALLGPSPDGGKRAVFAILAADGSLTQGHAELGVDGLAPAGTVTPQTGAPIRTGMLFNWIPDRKLFITDAARNAIVMVPLGDDTHVFTTSAPSLMKSAALHRPIDLAPAVPETANGGFSSNTTLAGNSDMYVLNADGTIVRMRQDGSVVGVRRVSIGGAVIGAGRLNGIGTSSDAKHVWLTVRDAIGTEAPGAVIEIPAFGAAVALDAAPAAVVAAAVASGDNAALVATGSALFHRTFTPKNGLGPLYNERSCFACHLSPSAGGVGPKGLAVAVRIPLEQGGPVARIHSINEIGYACALTGGIPARVSVTSIRNALSLYDDAAIDRMSDADIAAGAIAYPDGVQGRAHWVTAADGNKHVGRFGWKADSPTLHAFIGEAMRNEMGITNPEFSHDLARTSGAQQPCPGESMALKDDGTMVRALTAYVASLTAPESTRPHSATGATVFASIGCTECHATRLRAGNAPLFSDLLLHDMGATLDDGIVQGLAQGRDWRTTSLRGAGFRSRLLHDGRAATIPAAVIAHDGEAAASVKRYRALTADEQRAVTDFVASL